MWQSVQGGMGWGWGGDGDWCVVLIFLCCSFFLTLSPSLAAASSERASSSVLHCAAALLGWSFLSPTHLSPDLLGSGRVLFVSPCCFYYFFFLININEGARRAESCVNPLGGLWLNAHAILCFSRARRSRAARCMVCRKQDCFFKGFLCLQTVHL